MSVIINGNNTPVAGGVAVGTSSGELAFTAAGTSGQYLISNGAGVEPTWQTGSGGALPGQAGHAGEFLTTDGTTASWAAAGGGGSEFTGTAYKAVTIGQAVVVNPDGTISQVTPSDSNQNGSANNIAGTQYFGPFEPVYDAVNNQYFAIWSDYSSPVQLWYQAYTSSGTTLTPVGSPTSFYTGITGGGLSYNSQNSIIIGTRLYTFIYYYGSTAPELVVSDITAGALTFNNAVTIMSSYFSNSTPTSTSMEYSTLRNRLVVVAVFAYAGVPSSAIETFDVSSAIPSVTGSIDLTAAITGTLAGEPLQVARAMIYQPTATMMILCTTNAATVRIISVNFLLAASGVYSGSIASSADTTYSIANSNNFTATFLPSQISGSPGYHNGIALISFLNSTYGAYTGVYIQRVNIYGMDNGSPFMAFSPTANTTPVANTTQTALSGVLSCGPVINPTFQYLTTNSSTDRGLMLADIILDFTYSIPSGITVNSNEISFDKQNGAGYAYNLGDNTIFLVNQNYDNTSPNYYYLQATAIKPAINSNLYKKNINTSSNLVGIAKANCANGGTVSVQTVGAVNSNQTDIIGGTTYFAYTYSYPAGVTIQPTGSIPIGVGLNSTSILITL